MPKKRKDHRFETDDLLLIVRPKGKKTVEFKTWRGGFFQERQEYAVHFFQKKEGRLVRLGAFTKLRPGPGHDSPRQAAVDALAFAYQPNWYEWDGSEDYAEGQDYPYDRWSPHNKRWFRLHERYDWENLPQDRDGEFRVWRATV